MAFPSSWFGLIGFPSSAFGKVSDFIDGATRVTDNGDTRVTSSYYLGRSFLVSSDTFLLTSSDDQYLVSEGILTAGNTRVTSRSL